MGLRDPMWLLLASSKFKVYVVISFVRILDLEFLRSYRPLTVDIEST